MTMLLRRGKTPEGIDRLHGRAAEGDVQAMLRIAEIAAQSRHRYLEGR